MIIVIEKISNEEFFKLSDEEQLQTLKSAEKQQGNFTKYITELYQAFSKANKSNPKFKFMFCEKECIGFQKINNINNN